MVRVQPGRTIFPAVSGLRGQMQNAAVHSHFSIDNIFYQDIYRGWPPGIAGPQPSMRPSEAPTLHRAALRQLLNRYGFLQPQDAMVRTLTVIGEAAVRIHKEAPQFVTEHPRLPWSQMRGHPQQGRSRLLRSGLGHRLGYGQAGPCPAARSDQSATANHECPGAEAMSSTCAKTATLVRTQREMLPR